MKLYSNCKAVSNLILLILLLVSFIGGALFSYLWTIAPYVEYKVAEDKTALIITNVSFDPQNARQFNITVLNPSYSKEDAYIMQIGFVSENATFILVTNVTVNNEPHGFPSEPIVLKRGEEKTITCKTYWGEFAGQVIDIVVSGPNIVGPSVHLRTPFVKLEITDVSFNSSLSIKYFGLTVRNHPNSTIPLNIIGITTPLPGTVTFDPPLPRKLDPDQSVHFNCSGDWGAFKELSIVIETSQGFVARYLAQNLSTPALLNLTETDFNIMDTKHFRLTIQNEPESPTRVDISKIEFTLEDGTKPEVNLSPQINETNLYYYRLPPSNFSIITCEWDWTNYRDKKIDITVHTKQGFVETFSVKTPPPINMTVLNASFNITDTTRFGITVKNSPYPFSIKNANITRITITLKNGTSIEVDGTQVTPKLPCLININENKTFICSRDWASFQNTNITITVYTIEGYSAKISLKTPMYIALNMAEPEFNENETCCFKITLENSISSFADVTITQIDVTVENQPFPNRPIENITLPYTLKRNEIVTFTCFWRWGNYRGEDVTVTVRTLEGVNVSKTTSTPPPIIITILDAAFNEHDTTRFNVTIKNSQYSLQQTHIAEINVTLTDGTNIRINGSLVSPQLPYPLDVNWHVTFVCSWDWSSYRSQSITITVSTLDGYKAHTTITLP